MNEKESHEVKAEDPRPNKGDHVPEDQHQETLLHRNETTNQTNEMKPHEGERLCPVLPVHAPNDQGPEGQRDSGGFVRRPGFRSKSGIGPPPRPFKKARYAWEIKNYEHTLSNMNQNIGECSTDLHDESQDSQSSDVNSEGSQEDGVLDHREGLLPGALERAAFMDPRARPRPDLMPPIMPAPYPTTYGMMTAPPPPNGSLRPGDCLKEGQQPIPPDPDASILRWQTKQLCRSIFDNTVNRMLENMGFSPVTERSQGIHPLLVLSLSDDEEREADEAQQRALENEALTAAMHNKGLFLPPYHYDTLESGGTTTDYDSSDDDSDLGEEPVPDDLAHETHMHITHMINNRPLPRVPVIPAMPAALVTPASEAVAAAPTPPCSRPMSPHQIPPQQPQATDCDVDACDADVPRKDTNSDEDAADDDDQEEEEEEEDDDDDDDEEEEEDESLVDNNKNSVVGDQNNHVTQEAESRGGGGGGGGVGVGVGAADKQTVETQSKTENENNNDKYFVDQAIEMAIKQQGLGYQQA